MRGEGRCCGKQRRRDKDLPPLAPDQGRLFGDAGHLCGSICFLFSSCRRRAFVLDDDCINAQLGLCLVKTATHVLLSRGRSAAHADVREDPGSDAGPSRKPHSNPFLTSSLQLHNVALTQTGSPGWLFHHRLVLCYSSAHVQQSKVAPTSMVVVHTARLDIPARPLFHGACLDSRSMEVASCARTASDLLAVSRTSRLRIPSWLMSDCPDNHH